MGVTESILWKRGGMIMRKMLCALLALAMVLTMGAAMAEVTLTQTGSFNSNRVEWVDGTNLLRVPGTNGYALVALEGAALTGDVYSSFSYENGYIVARENRDGVDANGLLALDGTVVMPMKYGDVEVLSGTWAAGYVLKEATADNYDYKTWGDPTQYYLIDTVDIYYLPELRIAATLPRTNFSDAAAFVERISIQDRATGKTATYDKDMNVVASDLYSIYDDDYADLPAIPFYKVGRYGLQDAAGNVILEPTYETIYTFYGDKAEATWEDKHGLITQTGEEILAPVYDDVLLHYERDNLRNIGGSCYDAYGYYGVIADGKFGYVNSEGEYTFAPKYAKDVVDFGGASTQMTDLEGKLHLLAADGVETVIQTPYNSMYALEFSRGMLYKVTNESYDYGVIDWHNETVLPMEYDGVEVSGDGAYLLVTKGKETLIYAIDYGFDGTPAQETAAEAAASSASNVIAAVGKAAAKGAAKAGKGDGAQETTDESVTAQQVAPAQESDPAARDNSAAVVLIDNAILLLNTDAAANGVAAKALLDSAATLLAGTNDAAAAMLTSAGTLLQVDAAANAASAVTLLETAKTML